MFNSGFRGKRASDGAGITGPQSKFIQSKYPVPTITGYTISGTDDTALNTAGGQTVLVNGGGFASGCAVTVNGTAVTPVTVVSPSQISFTSPANSGGSYTLVVYNTTGGGAILVPGLTYSSVPTYTTSAGSIGSGYETTSISTSVTATSDSSLTYAVTSGSLPAGASMTSGGVITGTYPVVASGTSTTYSFDITATDAELQDVTRSFSLTTNIDVVTWVTPSSGETIDLNGTSYSQSLSATDAAGYSVSYTANALPTGLTLSTGTISGTPTVEGSTTTLLTATAATTGRSQTNTITWVVSLSDVYFKYTTLLLSSSDSLQSQSFVSDNSLNNAQLTVAGDTKAQNFNPYQHGYYSNYFDGTGDYLTLTGTNLSSSNFTIECWVNFSSFTTAAPHIFNFGSAGTDRYNIWRNTSTGKFSFTTANADVYDIKDGTTSPVINTWYHVALVSNSGTRTMYINGVAEVTSTSAIASGTNWSLGFMQFTGGAADYLTGYISNFRVLKDTALYTSNFTPSTTPLLPVANTILLTCQSNRLIDNSVSNYTLTKNGDTKVTTAHPFTTVYQAGQQYYSTKFDGTGDYLTTTTSTGFGFGTGTFTFECWVYPTSNPTNGPGTLIDCRSGTNAEGWVVRIFNNLTVGLYNGPSNVYVNSTGTVTMNTWQHIAIVRSSTSSGGVAFYINGSSAGTATVASNLGTTWVCKIGTNYAAGYDFYGNISNLRVVKGDTVYTASFTPSTTPLTAISGTSLLTCQDSTFKDNSTNNFTITPSGDAKPLGVSPFTPSSYTNTEITSFGSGYFDGTGDYLTLADSPSLRPISVNFTLECWVYFTANATSKVIATFGQETTSGFATSTMQLKINSSNQFEFNSTNYVITTDFVLTSSITASLNTWYHLAVTRRIGVDFKFFVNGITVATATDYNNNRTSGPYHTIGAQYRSSAYNDFMTGYVSDLRLINGTAIYTSNFVPQLTSPLTNVTNTSLLTLQSNGSHNNSVFKDGSSFNNLITRNGNTTNGTFSPYGDNWSILFNRGYVYSPMTGKAAGTGSFTYEMFVFINIRDSAVANQANLFSTRSSGNGGDGIDVTVSSSKQIMIGTAGTTYLTSSTNIVSDNTWFHFAVVRNGTTSCAAYINGSSIGTFNAAVDFTSTDCYLGIYGGGGNDWLKGYISNFRYTKSAVYTSSFTPSTSPLQPLADTACLMGATNRFVDSSTSNYTLVLNAGNGVLPTIQKFSPFGTVTVSKYYSAYFDGTGDYLTVPSNTGFAFGTGDYTLEFWLYPTVALSSTRCFYNNNSGGYFLQWASGSGLQTGVAGSSATGTYSASITSSTWTHVAISRASGSSKCFLNGTQTGTTVTDNTNYAQNGAYIGALYDGSQAFTGYISNLRVIKGTALYTTNFTPSTSPLTAVSGTSLLTCRDNTVKDNSTNNFTITTNGDVKPRPVSPFTPTASSPTSYSPTVFSGSMYFDGTDDSLSGTLPSGGLGSGSFCVEGWIYPMSRTSGDNGVFMDTRGTTTTGSGANFGLTTTNGYPFFYTGASFIATASVAPALNAWSHLAYVRNGTAVTIYLNGVSVATGTSSANLTDTGFHIGTVHSGTATYYKTYISDFRVTVGTPIYTSSFYPGLSPATPTTTIGTSTYNSSLLLSGTSSGVIDATRTVDIETVADAKVTNFSPYNGSYYSNYFNTNGLSLQNNSGLQFGTGDFTLELWIWSIDNVTSDIMEIQDRTTAGSWALVYQNSVIKWQSRWGTTDVVTSGSNLIRLSSWNHIAVVRISGVTKIYLNGAEVGSASDSTNYTPSTSFTVTIGGSASAYYNNYYGYISNIRVVKGVGVYSSAFTPPSAPLTAISGTSLLTCQSNKLVDNSINNSTLSLAPLGTSPQVATQNPFQVNTGLSYYFDGTGDYLQYAKTPQSYIGSGNFTIEAWIYLPALPSSNTNMAIVGQWNSSDLQYLVFVRNNAGTMQLVFGYSTDGVTGVTTKAYSASIVAGVWCHIAISRSGSNFYMFVNGSIINPADTFTLTLFNAVGPMAIGRSGDNANYLTGYISDLRITKGYARYTTTFTPPTLPYKTN